MNKISKPINSPATSLLIWLVPLLIFFLVVRTPNDNDMWWHLRNGHDMVLQHQILTHDQFSFTRAGTPWVNAFWLADIFYYLVYSLGDFFGLSLVAASIVTLTMTLVFIHSPGPVQLRAVLILIAGFGISAFSAVRPQLISFLFLTLMVIELERTKQTGKLRPFVFIVMFIAWGNIHGGYIWGLMLLLAYIVGEVLNRITQPENSLSWSVIGKLGLASLASGFVTVINPNGPAIWKLPFYTVQVSIGTINEWASPDFHRVDIQPMLWLIFLLVIGLGFTRKKIDGADALKFLGFAFLAFISQRSLGPFLVIAVPVVSRYLGYAWNENFNEIFSTKAVGSYQRQSTSTHSPITFAINSIIITILIIACVGRVYWLSNKSLVFSEYPKAAVDWVAAQKLQGPMFNSYNWGGYLTWALPQQPVFIDGRADLYGSEIIQNWWEMANGSSKGLALLDEYKINYILLEPSWPLISKLPALGWHELYRDNEAVIMGR